MIALWSHETDTQDSSLLYTLHKIYFDVTYTTFVVGFIFLSIGQVLFFVCKIFTLGQLKQEKTFIHSFLLLFDPRDCNQPKWGVHLKQRLLLVLLLVIVVITSTIQGMFIMKTRTRVLRPQMTTSSQPLQLFSRINISREQ